MMMSLHARVVMQGEEELGPTISKNELTNRAIDLEKPSRE
jgi:hypothetical protein